MKLYANDIGFVSLDTLHHPDFDDTADARDAIMRILPRRCTSDWHQDPDMPDRAEGHYGECAGWLYPDPPDIPYYAAWKQDEASMALWRRTLEHVWRAMGITDED